MSIEIISLVAINSETYDKKNYYKFVNYINYNMLYEHSLVYEFAKKLEINEVERDCYWLVLKTGERFFSKVGYKRICVAKELVQIQQFSVINETIFKINQELNQI